MKFLATTLVGLAATASLASSAPIQESGLQARSPVNCLADVIAHQYLHKRSGTWSYEGKTGSAHWGELDPSFATCSAGKNQSPINLEDEQLYDQSRPSFGWASSVQKASFVNNGHTIQVNIPAGSTIKLASNQTYQLKQFHFHSPSEHHKHEKYYPLEVHFVHATSDLPPKLAVVGVFFELGSQPNAFLDQLVRYIPKQANGNNTIPSLRLDLMKNRIEYDHYWTYSGSLTTPPCTEGVAWNVMDQPLSITPAQLKAFTDAMPYNARSTM
ncbi:carbonate dehydratase [Polychytrium aggregatum]|uniref:carbonate dehydratase n=1 Tax=Polychytrium aggregatum TaxID=110093 RepID=UPI0022FEDBF4|nr:carbonate dehydratase [Polychytrium aggregatum]KAI9202183.1 carbonate dehydratase [Polychytrium aggregatum]